MHKRIALNGLAILLLAAAGTASAQEAPGFYAGAGIGSSTIKIDDVDFDANDMSFKVFGGYAFNSNFAVEVAYFDSGTPEETVAATPTQRGTVDVGFTGFNVSAVGRVPVNDMFSLFGKLGYASYSAEITGRINGVTLLSADGDDDNLSYGIGGAFSFGKFELRAEYEGINVEDGDFNTLSIGGLYRF